ncbi:MAG: hypothetical protein ACOYL6_07365 [Bacteriovoracaceae bacterium]
MSSARLENSIEESDYPLPSLSKVKWTLLVLGMILAGFLFNFSFAERIENLVRSALTQNASCPVSYKDMKFEFFWPKVIVHDISMPGRCVSETATKAVELKQVAISLIGMSFSPLGINSELKTNFDGSIIHTKQIVGSSEQIINTLGTKLDLSTLMPYFSTFKMGGHLETSALTDIQNKKVYTSKFLLKSKDFFIPAQRLESLDLPNMKINNFLFKGSYDRSGKIKIESLVLGDEKSPIRANFKGELWPNEFQFRLSRIDLTGEVIFSESFLESFSIIKLFFSQFPQKDGYYQIKLGGTLTSPTPIQ